MHILEKYYFVDDQGTVHELKCTVTRAINDLGQFEMSVAEEELNRIRNSEIEAELSAMGVGSSPWWKFW